MQMSSTLSPDVDVAATRRTDVPKVELSQVTLAFQSPREETLAVHDVSLTIAPGEFVSIVGPSGCGKSTCLSMLAGLQAPTAGTVSVDGVPVTGPSGKVGIMLQHDHLFEWRDVLENVLVGAEVLGKNTRQSRERAVELLQRYGLGEFMQHRPAQLSGGMRQRVALIRTLVTDPDVILLDEPFSALDFQTRLTLADEIVAILRKQGKTALLVTHDITEAISMSDRVIVMSGRPGTVKAEHRIPFASRQVTPFEAREQPEFSRYFATIWEELDAHVRS
jgi:NitT/TauT family transport system ATP-binding protein